MQPARDCCLPASTAYGIRVLRPLGPSSMIQLPPRPSSRPWHCLQPHPGAMLARSTSRTQVSMAPRNTSSKEEAVSLLQAAMAADRRPGADSKREAAQYYSRSIEAFNRALAAPGVQEMVGRALRAKQAKARTRLSALRAELGAGAGAPSHPVHKAAIDSPRQQQRQQQQGSLTTPEVSLARDLPGHSVSFSFGGASPAVRSSPVQPPHQQQVGTFPPVGSNALPPPSPQPPRSAGFGMLCWAGVRKPPGGRA
eukprot:COSAG01_NODE_9985_length_2283_cov_6.297619_3_plen_253_part_00